MHEADFWTKRAEQMEMSIEGNRLIVREIADLVRDLWTRAIRSFGGLVHGHPARHRHLPPV